MKTIIIKIIEFYQIYLSFDRGVLSFFAPGGACRYSPTCSEYTKQMVVKYGIFKGLYKGGRRLLTCHP